MKRYFRLLPLLAALLLSGCFNNEPPAIENDPPAADTKANYIAVDGLLMGSFDQNGWHSVSEYVEEEGFTESLTPKTTFFVSDLIAAESYQLYTLDEFIGSTEEIILCAHSYGLGAFGSEEHPYTEEMRRAVEEIALPVYQDAEKKYLDNSSGRFALGQDLSQGILADLVMPDYDAYCDFSLDDTLSYDDIRLALSASHNPLPRKVQILYELDEPLTDYITQQLALLGIPDAPVNLSHYYVSDFDYDGQEESLIIAQTQYDEWGEPIYSQAERDGASGRYIIIVYQDGRDSQPQTVYGWCQPYTSGNITDVTSVRHAEIIGVYDLNGDGNLEICLDTQMWEGGQMKVYALDDSNHYQLVLLSWYGM